MADKGALEMIGAMLCAATLFVVGMGGFVVSSQLGRVDEAAAGVRIAQLPSPASPGLISTTHPALAPK